MRWLLTSTVYSPLAASASTQPYYTDNLQYMPPHRGFRLGSDQSYTANTRADDDIAASVFNVPIAPSPRARDHTGIGPNAVSPELAPHFSPTLNLAGLGRNPFCHACPQ